MSVHCAHTQCADYEFLDILQEVAEQKPLGDNKRRQRMKRGVSGRGNYVDMEFAETIVENDLPRWTLVQVVSDPREHGVNSDTNDETKGLSVLSRRE